MLLVLLVGGASQWWRDHLTAQAGRELTRLARPGDIEMISSTTCVFCAKARAFMTAQKVPFDECFIETDAGCAQRYQAFGARGTPTLLVRGQLQIGFSAPLVRDRLAEGRDKPGA